MKNSTSLPRFGGGGSSNTTPRPLSTGDGAVEKNTREIKFHKSSEGKLDLGRQILLPLAPSLSRFIRSVRKEALCLSRSYVS